jgi:hypothetical protein
MTPLSSGDSLGVAGASVPGPLGFGVSGGGGADPDPLGFGGASYGVSDRSWVMFRSMELSSHSSSCCCWLDVIWWLVPEPLTVVKGLNPLDPSVNQPRSVVAMKEVPKATTCGGDGDGSIERYDVITSVIVLKQTYRGSNENSGEFIHLTLSLCLCSLPFRSLV